MTCSQVEVGPFNCRFDTQCIAVWPVVAPVQQMRKTAPVPSCFKNVIAKLSGSKIQHKSRRILSKWSSSLVQVHNKFCAG